ncbi:cation diffusion facilitator family transporter [Mesorhizobium sp. RMAD-H1]|uniref:cation diffusion facilitator family transporter n=1 Tax=Mesorhizobium sp. RMAD-H1 TaxID=2587065 RepID=UPI00160D8981|nr:cation diffusion facilitator family transporter [Mesorhizobium sp. RMAD-H1]MBB2973763.1 cobalt-zinc-cadmium efflux system protein [Mesorhizobium sp. RMAD-H1]
MAHEHSHHDHSHGDSHHGHDHNHDHDYSGLDKRRVFIAAVLTAGFMVVEALGGLFTGSLALLADAGHMLTDSVSLGLAWYAFHLGERPATNRHTYGFGRVKTLVAYTNGLAIFVVGAWIVYEAWERFEQPSAVLGGPMLAVGIAGLVVNIAAFLVLHGGDRENLNMRGAILHVLGDLLGSVAAIAAALIILFTGWYPIDPILSALVAVMLFMSAWRLTRDAGQVLLEGAPDVLDRDDIARDLEKTVPGVDNIHHMHVWSLDGKSNLATLHARIADEGNAAEVTRLVKERLASMHGITHATVETEAGPCADGYGSHGCEMAGKSAGRRHSHEKRQGVAGSKDT